MASPSHAFFTPVAQLSRGLTAFDTVSGIGLDTLGFLWGCADIWSIVRDPVTTTWASSFTPVTTTWVACSNCSTVCAC